MKKFAIIGLGALAMAAAMQVNATVVLSSESTGWQMSTDNGSSWTTAQAGFGSAWFYPGVHTDWPVNTDILVKYDLNLGGYIPSTATYKLGIDNGLDLSVNGVVIYSQLAHEGVAHIGDFQGALAGAHSGHNDIELVLRDWGYASYFDMTVSATPVPEPSTIVAGALVLIPFAASGLRSLRKNRA